MDDPAASVAAEETDAGPVPAAAPVPLLHALELDLPEAAAERLTRAVALRGAVSVGRATTVAITWHDTPDAALAGQGLALAHERGIWRLERLAPGSETWPPAAPPPLLAEAARLEDLAPDLPATMPVVSGHGRRRVLHVPTEAGEVTATLLVLSLRAFAGETQRARLTLHGSAGAVASLAAALAAELPLTPPRASLAAEAHALARGIAPAAHRRGAPVVPADASTEAALAQIVAHLVDGILGWAEAVGSGQTPEPVHQMRVALRRLRSALSLFAPLLGTAMERPRATLKQLATILGPAREWHVFLDETAPPLAAAFGHDPRLDSLLNAARRRRKAAYAGLHEFFASPAWRATAIELACLATLCPWLDGADAELRDRLQAPAAEFAAFVLERRTRSLLRHGRDFAALPAAELHELRKRAKKLRYAGEFFAPAFAGKKQRRFLERLVALQEELGRVNDQATVAALLEQLPPALGRGWAGGAVTGFVAGHEARSRRKAAAAWQEFLEADRFWAP